MTEKLTATVPIHFIGDAPAVKGLGAILVKNLSEVEVECLPMDLPHALEVNLETLAAFNTAIRVSDLKVSDKVKILANLDEVIVTVEEPRSEEELKALEEKPVEADVTKVEGVVKPEAEPVASAEGQPKEEKKTDKE
jgi:large subunit ribosomal protein L25